MRTTIRAVLLAGMAVLGSLAAKQDAPRVPIEFRAAEDQPGPGLTGMVVHGSDRKVYVRDAALLTNADLESATVKQGEGEDTWVIEIVFTAAGTAKFAAATAASIGKPLAVLVDGKVVSAAIAREGIPGGRAVITGAFTGTEAQRLANVLSHATAQGPAQPLPPVPPDPTPDIERFYAGVDAETQAFLRRGVAGARLVPEGTFEQAPAAELAAERQEWLWLISGDRYQAIENLGAARCVEAVPALLRIATERGPGDSRARWLAVRALGRIGDERAIPELIHLVNYYEENTRMWARASLYRLTGQWFGGDREAWGNWWNQTGGEPKYVSEQRYPEAQMVPGGTMMRLVIADTPMTGVAGNGKRAWGPEQAAGEPDTFQAGDIVTAWASLTPDASPEWLQLDYEKAVTVAGVGVRETHNPGAVCKVTAVADDGTQTTLWEGKDPTTEAPGVFAVPVQGEVTARRIKVYVDSPRVLGWNEIDAVELVGKDGSRQWASRATASSTYAERGGQRRKQGRPEIMPEGAGPVLPPPTRVPPHLEFRREGAFYWNDFEDPATAGRGWSRQDTYRLPAPPAVVDANEVSVLMNNPEGRTVGPAPAAAPAGPTTVLGRFGNEPVSLTLEGLPPHRFVQVSFELYALSSWDGDGRFKGPDLWEARLENGPRLVYASFAPPHNEAPSQSFPLDFGLGALAPGSAGRRVSAPIPFNDGRSPTWTQHFAYPMCFTIPHTAPTLRVWFTGIGLQELDDESWALDNVGVALLTEAPPSRELSPEQLDRAWGALASEDPIEVWRAMQALTGAGDQAVDFLVAQLGLAPDDELVQRVEAVATAFAHDDPDQWQEAVDELDSLPARVLPLAIARLDRRRFGANPPLTLLREFIDGRDAPDAGPARRREERAVHVLELVWTGKARSALLFQ